MSALPNGWQVKTLGEVAVWGSGGTPQAGNPAYYGGSIPWAIIGDLNDGIVSTTEKSITEDGLANSSAKLVPAGAILIAMYGSIGKMGIAGVPMATNQAIAFALPNHDLILPTYLFWFLSSQRELFLSQGKGATQQNISQTLLKAWQIPVPPLDEQGRIVETLDDHLSRLDKALAELSRNRSRFSSLRKAYLDAMYRGAMSPSFGSPEIVRLSDVAAIINGDRGKNYPSKSFRVSAGIPFINAGHVDHGSIDMATMDFISPERFDLLGSGKVAKGDVLFCLRGSLGKVGIVRDFEKGAIASSLAILRSNERTLPEYLLGYFQTSTASEMIRRFDNGTAQPNLSSANLAKFEVPLFSLEIQEQIVSQVQAVKQNLETLEAAHVHLTLQVNKLRRSVLHSAFQADVESGKTLD